MKPTKLRNSFKPFKHPQPNATARIPNWLLLVASLLCLWFSGFLAGKAAASERDHWDDSDKVMHYAAGAAIGATAYAIVETIAPNIRGWKKHALAIGASALVGVVKEYADSRDRDHHTCDARDAVATVAGGVVGSISCSLVFRF